MNAATHIDSMIVFGYTRRMKRLLILILLCSCPLISEGHPGKTDRYGGHKCMRGCEEWGLFYEEYHFHDKDGNPIHLKKSKQVKEPEVPAAAVLESNSSETYSLPTDGPKTEVVTTYRYVTTVYEENLITSNPLLFVLAILLLLLLILRMNRKREEG